MAFCGRPSLRVAAILLVALACIWHGPAPAQSLDRPDPDTPVTLVADEVIYDPVTETVTASGSVEVYYGDRTLTADRIIYNDQTGRIIADGDIVLRDPSGTTVFADTADLDADLKDGLVTGARSVLNETTRLAAVEAQRVNERYNTLSKVVYSPCEVCPELEVPLWRIRARRVIHDEVEKIIHYENATFDVFGVPIAWLPYFRHPDPTVDRASGFLAPSFSASGNYGQGLRVPYFWVIDDHSDLTLTPFLLTEEPPIFELEYRRLFEQGGVRIGGSIGYSDFDGEEGLRGHVDAEGRYNLGNDITTGFNINFASDDDYLNFFDISSEDRLSSDIFVRRYRQDGYFDVSGLYFQSLRDNEAAGDIPLGVPVFDARQEFDDPFLGGEFGAFSSGQILLRNNGDDTARLSVGADWERTDTLPIGLEVTTFAEIRADVFSALESDGNEDELRVRLAPLLGVEGRYPLIWEQDSETAHIIEPVIQAIMAPYGGNDANEIIFEDSLVQEFDETNVIDRNHFSGLDNVEEGPRINLLLRYDLLNEGGFNFDASIGRVYRFRDVNAFSAGSGLVDTESDYVAAWNASYAPYFNVSHRMRLADDGSITRNEALGSISVDPVSLSANYIFIEADPLIGAPDDREEVNAGIRLKIDDNWRTAASMRRDLQLSEFVRVGGSITYSNECCEIEGFIQRRFTETDGVEASTSGGVRVKLITLGGSN